MPTPPLLHDATRRRLLYAAAGLFGLSLSGAATRVWPAQSLPKDDPFRLGVASGDPAPDGVVIWTRLAPMPQVEGGGMPEAAFEVDWELAEDEQFIRIAARGTALAEPAWAHSLHVEVGGLQPARDYWYRFRAGAHRSPVGRTRSLPAPGASPAQLRFAFASCQHYEAGYYAAYRHLADDAPQLVLHLGDYIYEGGVAGGVRSHGGGKPQSLAQYRRHHAVYKTDPDLQRAHASAPWIVTWDDHDVQNDYAGTHSAVDLREQTFLLRRAAAYQAYWEHLPLRASSRPRGPDAALYRRFAFGDLLSLQVLDTRQYRAPQPCGRWWQRGGQVAEPCAARLAPEQTMLGPAQERWLLQGLDASRARWNLIAQQLLMAPLDEQPGAGQRWWTDSWDGYPAARTRILQHLHSRQIANPVVLGGDIHSFWATDLKLDFADPTSATVATEFVGTSVTSGGQSQDFFSRLLPDNPHIRYFEGRRRGYARCELSRDRWRTEFIGLDDVRNAGSAAAVVAAFEVEPGRPGVQRA
jgi:alkaline phosphatase D